MCLMKGKADQVCLHPTCIRAKEDASFWNGTKSAMFHKQNDFNKVSVFPSGSSSQFILEPKNPHHKRTGNWVSFEEFKQACTFQVAGVWPPGNVFSKFDIDFGYFLFGRRIDIYDPLTETYSSEIILDVEEAAVYVGAIKQNLTKPDM